MDVVQVSERPLGHDYTPGASYFADSCGFELPPVDDSDFMLCGRTRADHAPRVPSVHEVLVAAGRRWLADHGECPQHGLVSAAHRCRDYDGEVFIDGYAPQGIEVAAKYLIRSPAIGTDR